MFEKFTEKARRLIFFARYEASQHGLEEIDTRCLLLGIFRENKEMIVRLLPGGSAERARLIAEVESLFAGTAQRIATSVDIPLSQAAKRVLVYGAEESERLGHATIDPRHLLLGLLREGGPETACLKAHGIELEKVRAESFQEVNLDKHDALDRPRGSTELLRALQEIPADRLQAAMTLLIGLASGKFEVTGTSRNGPFHFSFEDKTE